MKDILLEKCNITKNVPISFVSEYSIDSCMITVQPPNSEERIYVPITFVSDSMINTVTNYEKKEEHESSDENLSVGTKRLYLSPQKGGYTPERHQTKKQKPGNSKKKQAHLQDSSDSDIEIYRERPKTFKEMLRNLSKDSNSDSDSDEEFDKNIKPLHHNTTCSTPLCDFIEITEPTKDEIQAMKSKSFLSKNFDCSYDFQMVKTLDLWEFREFDRSLTPKYVNDINHLEQVRRYLLKNGFDEPLIISCDIKSGKAYLSEGNHRLWASIKENIEYVPCRVLTHWLPPYGLCKQN
jgi:hypothetical protein